jgi:deoxyadenosine/deoxycytidine kinase
MEAKIIFLEGIPGSGKTTLGNSYKAHNHNVIFCEEWVDEKILAEYIADMPNKATSFQFRAQEETIKKIRDAVEYVKSGKTVVIDRGISGNASFAELQFQRGFISEIDMLRYRERFSEESVLSKLEVPYEIWHLQCDPSRALTRIMKRNRNGESAYTLEYLESLASQQEVLLMNAKVVDMNVQLSVSSEGIYEAFSLEMCMVAQ